MGLWEEIKKKSKKVGDFFEDVGDWVEDLGDTVIGEKARREKKLHMREQKRAAKEERTLMARERAVDKARRRKGLRGRAMLRSSFKEREPTVGRSGQGSTTLGRGV